MLVAWTANWIPYSRWPRQREVESNSPSELDSFSATPCFASLADVRKWRQEKGRLDGFVEGDCKDQAKVGKSGCHSRRSLHSGSDPATQVTANYAPPNSR